MQPTQASNETRLPRAVIRQRDALNQRIADRNKPVEPETPPVVAAAPAEKPASTTPQPVEPQAATPAIDSRDTDPNYWKQRFNVTEGILRRERDERATERTNLNRRVTELQSEVETLKTKVPEPEIDLAEFFTSEEREKYGDEQCKVMARTAMRAGRAVKKPDAAAPPPASQPNAAAEAAKQEFTDKLTEFYPAWPVSDKDPRWLAWLDEIDNATGEPRGKTLDAFVVTGNARGAAGMFKAWEKAIAPAPAVAAPPPPAPATPPIAPSSRAATPGPGDAPAVPANAEAAAKGRPSADEIKDFYKRSSTKRKGQLGYVTDQERAAFEARLALPHAA